MAKVDLYNMKGEVVGEVELSDSIFASAISVPAMHSVVKGYLANQRQGTQSALTRGEVSGGGRKPWRQKGTGRARHGSTRSPQWTHGGVAFAPKPRDYRISINKKVKRLALKSALTSKLDSGDIIVVDRIAFEEIKTKSALEMLKALNVTGSAMIVTHESDQNVVKSARNIPKIATSPAATINTYDILKYEKFIVSRDAVSKIEEVFA